MGSHRLAVTIFLAVLSTAGATGSGCYARALSLQADVLLERGAAEAAEFARTLDEQDAKKQLVSFEERRVLLVQAALWTRIEIFCLLGTVVTTLGAYLLFLWGRLARQLSVVEHPGESPPPPRESA